MSKKNPLHHAERQMNNALSLDLAGLCLVIFLFASGWIVAQDQAGADIDRAFELLEDRDGRDFDTARGKLAVERAITYVEAFGFSAYSFGAHLYQQGHEQKCIYWYEAAGMATNKPDYFYGRAWYLWRSGYAEAAIRDIEFMTQKELPPIIEARTYLLRGRINIESRFFEEARSDLSHALAMYQSIEGKYGGQFLCLTELARLELELGNLEGVEPLLKEAIEADRKNAEAGYKPYGLAFVHEIRAGVLFKQKNWEAALEENEISQALYLERGKNESALAIQVKIGLLQFLNGNPKEAHRIASDISQRIEGSGRHQIRAYNTVTLAMISLCSGMADDYETRKQAALSWARPENGGEHILELIDYLEKKIPCPSLAEEKP